jgi:hypothetical protein
MGAVFEVERLSDGQRLALKVMSGKVSRELAESGLDPSVRDAIGACLNEDPAHKPTAATLSRVFGGGDSAVCT